MTTKYIQDTTNNEGASVYRGEEMFLFPYSFNISFIFTRKTLQNAINLLNPLNLSYKENHHFQYVCIKEENRDAPAGQIFVHVQ